MLPSLLLSVAAAQAPCPEVGAQTELAWSEYQSAELEAAAEHLAAAEQSLACQFEPLTSTELLELYWLRALVALSADDDRGLLQALQHAISVDHTQRPPVAYGPDLRSAWERLAREATLVSVVVRGPEPAFIDGRRVDPGVAVQVAAGQHVVQVREGLTFSTDLMDLQMSETISTGPLAPSPPEVPVVVRRRRPPVLFIATALAGAASAWALASGARSERSFQSSAYNAVSYEMCRFDQPCYPIVRENAIRADARRINTVYGVGYGMAVVTSGLLTLTVTGLPGRRADR